MTRPSRPAPPPTDNPIVLLRKLSLQKEVDFITELLDAHEAGQVDRAAKCAAAAISSGMELRVVKAMVGLVNNLAYDTGHYPTSVKDMLRKAADCGFHEYAYNAANELMKSAKGVKGFKEAEKYYKLAMAFEENPAIQAAAHVNYCSIIRDGLISGTPDWPAAVEIYETAARMGLVKAMFNAGNVCSWLANQGNKEYGARAAKWFKYALDFRENREIGLDTETPDFLETVFEQCMLGLSAMHIDALFEDAQLEEGIRWAKEAANRGNPAARNNLGIGYTRRVAMLKAKPQNSPGENWRSVLEAMDWVFKGEAEFVEVSLNMGESQIPVLVDKLLVQLEGVRTIPLFVAHDPCLPQFGGVDRLCKTAEALNREYGPTFLLLTRKTFFMEKDGRSITPIYVLQNQVFSRQQLWMSGSPSLVLEHAEKEVDYSDVRYSNWSCMIPIAVNTLDEGFVVADFAKFNQPWVSVGDGWRMPFVTEESLHSYGIGIEKSNKAF